ncbi:MAG: DUF2330 domain-containing protein [Myxococcota bacterium]
MRLVVLIANVALALTIRPTPVSACGGFFCSTANPVLQSAEQIIFREHGDGTVTAIVQIQYAGPAERFAWVLPVPGAPDVGVSTNMLFQRLQGRTAPVYRLATDGGTCLRTRGGVVTESSDGTGVTEAESPAVSVIDGGTVGPFDFVTIRVRPDVARPGDVAVEWLQENGYDVDDFGRERLSPYLAGGMNLIAFRLTKGRSEGSIRPIQLRYETDHPMIPIRPTAVAAAEDMGVLVWVLGPSRAFPRNYRHLVLNEALINWLNPNANYNEVVSAAADEAGGHGFVTEMAGPTGELGPLLNSNESLEELRMRFVRNEGAAIRNLILNYQDWDGFRDALATVPLPAGTTVDDLLACSDCVELADDIPDFELDDFLVTLDREVFGPIRDGEAFLREAPWITRLYTTLSASEMDVDPTFDFNADLPAVSNFHDAERVVRCDRDRGIGSAPWRIRLSTGQQIYGAGLDWPYQVGDLPAAQRIEQLQAAGPPVVTADRRDEIDAVLATGLRAESLAGGGACSTSAGNHAWAALLFLVVVWRRRV